MPGYELSLILRNMKRPELKDALKRSMTCILENGGIVRKIENLGFKSLPYKMSAHNQSFTQGHFFVVDFDAPVTIHQSVRAYYKRDLDIVRHTLLNRETEKHMPASCEGQYTELYAPSMKDYKRFKPEVKEKLRNIKLK